MLARRTGRSGAGSCRSGRRRSAVEEEPHGDVRLGAGDDGLGRAVRGGTWSSGSLAGRGRVGDPAVGGALAGLDPP